jgi:hypothetical protein
MATGTISEEDLDRWSQHPVVGEALGRIGDGYSALDLLSATHEVMTDLEVRFPGLNYNQIFNGHKDPDPQRLIGTARACGASKEDLELVFGPSTHVNEQLGPDEYELVHQGLMPAEIQKLGYGKDLACRISALRHPVTDTEQEVLDYMDATPGVSGLETSRRLNVNPSTVRQAQRKRRYRQWLGQNAA